MNVLVVGAGTIGREYASILHMLGHTPQLVCNTESTATAMREILPPMQIYSGGIERYVMRVSSIPDYAIIATPIEDLSHHTLLLLRDTPVKNILVEKPLSLDMNVVHHISTLAEARHTNLFVAFNRRWFPSVRAAKHLIQQDGGVTSFHFDCTEIPARISFHRYSSDTLAHFGIANSSHVIDLAFYLGGMPRSLVPDRFDSLEWHPAGAIFAGCGRTQSDAIFSYHANWKTPGRWELHVNTPRRKLRFYPLESFSMQCGSSFRLQDYPCEPDVDEAAFKPGFYYQVRAFLASDVTGLMTAKLWSEQLKWIQKIFGYDCCHCLSFEGERGGS